jgi:hypothetical protein
MFKGNKLNLFLQDSIPSDKNERGLYSSFPYMPYYGRTDTKHNKTFQTSNYRAGTRTGSKL